MTSILAILAGGAYSAAYISQKPWCYVFLAISTTLVAIMRGIS